MENIGNIFGIAVFPCYKNGFVKYMEFTFFNKTCSCSKMIEM